MPSDINMIVIGDGGGNKIHKSLCMTPLQTEAIAADATLASFTINATALTHTIVLKLPNWTNAVTARISIENANGDEIYGNSADGVYSLARNTTHTLAVEKPLVGDNTVKTTLSGVPGGTGGDTETTIYLQGK